MNMAGMRPASNHASHAEARALTRTTPRLRAFVPSVTTELYSTTDFRTLRRPFHWLALETAWRTAQNLPSTYSDAQRLLQEVRVLRSYPLLWRRILPSKNKDATNSKAVMATPLAITLVVDGG